MTREERRKMWADRIEAFQASGQSTTEWCAAQGINSNQLRYWLRKYKNQDKHVPSSAQWISVEIARSNVKDNPLLVRVGQATIEVKPGFDRDLLKDLVSTLAELC